MSIKTGRALKRSESLFRLVPPQESPYLFSAGLEIGYEGKDGSFLGTSCSNSTDIT